MSPGTDAPDDQPALSPRALQSSGSPCSVGRVTVAALLGAACTASVMLTMGGYLVSPAQAGPPAPSSRTLAQRATDEADIRPFDAGEQRLETIAEIRALREEVKQLRELLVGGRVQVGIANPDELKLEIDYAKLRDALKAP